MFYIYKETNSAGDEFNIFSGNDLDAVRVSAYCHAERHTKHERANEVYSIWGYSGINTEAEYNELINNSLFYPDPDFYERIAIGIFEVETSAAIWADGSGYKYESVVDSRIQDISNIDSINPERWWPEYCNYKRTVTGSGRDCKITVRVFEPGSYSHKTIFEISEWESNMFEWEN